MWKYATLNKIAKGLAREDRGNIRKSGLLTAKIETFKIPYRLLTRWHEVTMVLAGI